MCYFLGTKMAFTKHVAVVYLKFGQSKRQIHILEREESLIKYVKHKIGGAKPKKKIRKRVHKLDLLVQQN